MWCDNFSNPINGVQNRFGGSAMGVSGSLAPTTDVATMGAPIKLPLIFFFVIHPLEKGAIVLYSLFSPSY